MEQSVIMFPDSGLLCVNGRDTRTGDPNGVGKSSIFEAVYWVLGLNAIPATELKNFNSKSIDGVLTLENGPDLVEISRSSSSLVLKINNHVIPGSKPDLQKEIDKILGNQEIFEMLSYRRQEASGKFFYSADSKLKSFLTKCIPDLEKLEVVIQQAKDKLSQIQPKKDSISAQLATMKSSLPAQEIDYESRKILIQGSINKLQQDKELVEAKYRDPSLEEVEILDAIAKLQQSDSSGIPRDLTQEEMQQIATINGDIEAHKRNKLDLNETRIAISNQMAALQTSYSQILVKQKTKESLIAKTRDIIKQIDKLDADIVHYNDQNCPSCLRQWTEAEQKKVHALDHKSRLSQEMHSTGSELNAMPDFDAQISDIAVQNKKLKDSDEVARSEQSILDSKISKLESDIVAINNKIKHEAAAAKSLFSQQISHKKEILAQSLKTKNYQKQLEISNIDGLLRDVKNDLSLLDKDAQADAKLRSSISIAQKEFDILDKSSELESHVHHVSKNVLGLYFDQLMKELQKQLNEIVSEIPNVSDIVVDLTTARETKTGTTKTEITTTILKNGNSISFRSLSGGQMASLSLAADLALIHVLKQRTNILPNWLFLDEALDGVSPNSKEAALEQIKKYSSNGLVLMIEHATEIKEFFDGFISLEYDGSTTRLVS